MPQQDTPTVLDQRQAIAAGLAAEGFDVEIACAAGDRVPTAFTMAHRFTHHGYRLTYRVIEPHWVLISMYERIIGGPTLRDPFFAMTSFIDWLRQQNLGIDYVIGRVETAPYRQGRDLDDDRLLRYYLRWGGAELVPVEDVPGMSASRRMATRLEGIRFIKVGVPDFRMPKLRHRAKLQEAHR